MSPLGESHIHLYTVLGFVNWGEAGLLQKLRLLVQTVESKENHNTKGVGWWHSLETWGLVSSFPADLLRDLWRS